MGFDNTQEQVKPGEAQSKNQIIESWFKENGSFLEHSKSLNQLDSNYHGEIKKSEPLSAVSESTTLRIEVNDYISETSSGVWRLAIQPGDLSSGRTIDPRQMAGILWELTRRMDEEPRSDSKNISVEPARQFILSNSEQLSEIFGMKKIVDHNPVFFPNVRLNSDNTKGFDLVVVAGDTIHPVDLVSQHKNPYSDQEERVNMLKNILTVESVQMGGLDRNIVPLTIRYAPPKGQAGHVLFFGV